MIEGRCRCLKKQPQSQVLLQWLVNTWCEYLTAVTQQQSPSLFSQLAKLEAWELQPELFPGPSCCPAVHFRVCCSAKMAEQLCECDSTYWKTSVIFLCSLFFFLFLLCYFYSGLKQCLICLFSLLASNNNSLSHLAALPNHFSSFVRCLVSHILLSSLPVLHTPPHIHSHVLFICTADKQ